MSHMQVQLVRGTGAQVAAYAGPAGEVVVDTDDYSLAVQDGVTAGGAARLTPGILPPQGRLTLTSGVPVITGSVTAATTVYYTPYIGDRCPIFDGTVWRSVRFSETSLPLDATGTDTGYQQAGKLFDVFAFLNGGVFTIGTGPAWSSTTSRGSGAGTTQLQALNGRQTNAVSIALRYGSATGNAASVAANQATYLGTMYATANGQTAVMLTPAAAAGGAGNVIGLWNAYNRAPARAKNKDSNSSWTYGTASWRVSDNSTANAILWVDGLGQMIVRATHFRASTSANGFIGVNFDTTATVTFEAAPFGTGTGWNTVSDVFSGIGLHTAYPLENSASGTAQTYYGGVNGAFFLDLEW